MSIYARLCNIFFASEDLIYLHIPLLQAMFKPLIQGRLLDNVKILSDMLESMYHI